MKNILILSISIVVFGGVFNLARAEAQSERVIISEINYSPAGAQWVEIYNGSSEIIDLTKYKILDSAAAINGHSITIFSGEQLVAPGAIAIIAKNPEDFGSVSYPLLKSALGIKISGDTIVLKDGAKIIVDTVQDIGLGELVTVEGQSLQFVDGSWVSAIPTPGVLIETDNENEDADEVADTDSEDMTETPPAVETIYEEDEIIIETASDPVPKPYPLQRIMITEIAWMGMPGNQYGEWIEFYNPYNHEVDLNEWGIYKGEALLYTLSGKITPHGYYIIERTTPSFQDPLSGVNDDSGKWGAGGLSNKGEHVVFKDSQGRTVEDFDFSAGWPAGDNKIKETMQRDGDRWFTSPNTPKSRNIELIILPPKIITVTVNKTDESRVLDYTDDNIMLPEVQKKEIESEPEVKEVIPAKVEKKKVEKKEKTKEKTKDKIKDKVKDKKDKIKDKKDKEIKKEIKSDKKPLIKLNSVEITGSVINASRTSWIANLLADIGDFLSDGLKRVVSLFR